MLAVSRLYSFLDHKNGFNLHFLEGQKLIHDLVLMHPMTGSGFAYFRDAFLGLMPIIFFLKPGETLGIYIDSENPYFRLKIETNNLGQTRTLLLPENFNLFPMNVSGNARLTKMYANKGSPYNSVIELKEVPTKEVINQILNESYQTNSEVIIGELSDQSIMVTKLPSLNVNSNIDDTYSRREYVKKRQTFFHDVFEQGTDDIEKIVKMFEDHDYSYLGSKPVTFFCGCSRDRMVMNLRGLYNKDSDELFEGKETVEVVCDYCRTKYEVAKTEVVGS